MLKLHKHDTFGPSIRNPAMLFIRRQYRPLWFIITSLVLLAIFLIYWLYTVWTELYGSVYGETDYWSGEMIPYILVAFALMGIIVISFAILLRNLRREYQLGKLKNDFISSMSHELRSPITTIGIALEALSHEGYPPEQSKEFLKISKLELERLNLLVDRVLRLSMFEEQEPNIYPEPLDLSHVVQQVLGAMKLRAEKLSANISLQLEPDASYLVQGDRLHLTSVVFNLIDNALKYVKGVPEIRISLSVHEKKLVLKITDNGIGIPAEFQEKIFDKFFRVPAEMGVKASGHGLGLSYVAKVIQQHHGSIKVDSMPGQGSTFTVELPAGG
ncbi:MAG: HAMP domain-containing histidine kinase [Saprospiraceae bacterium]|nr:HAMP domain-containing histidine kinase [Saprospiraceae bacterium]